jgi:uncharacterized protein (DUF362 family)
MRVAVTIGNYRKQNLDQALNLVADDVAERLRSVRSVLIKPNFVSSSNQLASTHVDAVRSVIEFVRKYSGASILVAEAGAEGTKAAFRNFGFENLTSEYDNVQLVDLNDSEKTPVDNLQVSKIALEADFKISVAMLKTHDFVDVTMTLKNWVVGTVITEPQITATGKKWYRNKEFHSGSAEDTHRAIMAQYAQNKPDLAVIDGFMGMEGQGPTGGDPVEMKVALAGTDAMAVDRTASKLMGFNPDQVKYLSAYDQQVELVGEMDLTKLSRKFIRHTNSNI